MIFRSETAAARFEAPEGASRYYQNVRTGYFFTWIPAPCVVQIKKRPCRACLWEHTLVILLHLVSLRLTFKRVLIAGSVHRCTGRYGGRCVVAREQVISSTTSSSSCNNYAPDNFHKPYPSMSTNWSWDCSLRRDVFVPLSCRALNLAVKSPWKSRNDSGARV